MIEYRVIGKTILYFLYQMKTINLNHSILNHRQYTNFILMKYKDTEENYVNFTKNIDINSKLALSHQINLHPYMYTLSKINQLEYEGFVMFYKIYLKKTEIYDEEIDDLMEYISEDIVRMVTFIIAMQFYFL